MSLEKIKIGQLLYDAPNNRFGHITEIKQVLNIYDDPEVMYDVLWDGNEEWLTIPYYIEEIIKFVEDTGMNK